MANRTIDHADQIQLYINEQATNTNTKATGELALNTPERLIDGDDDSSVKYRIRSNYLNDMWHKKWALIYRPRLTVVIKQRDPQLSYSIQPHHVALL